jgi:hypothetical protein
MLDRGAKDLKVKRRFIRYQRDPEEHHRRLSDRQAKNIKEKLELT